MLRAAVAAFTFAGATAAAGEVEFSGSVAGEGRVFPSDPRFDDQFSHVQSSLILLPELSYRSDDDRNQANFVPFLRLDSQDSERTHADLREGYWRTVQDQWDLLIGINSVFWGVTESRHLINVINQVDLVENSDEEDFLGQPMVNLGSQRDWGRVDLFVLPGFRERNFPGRDGRLRASLPVDEGAARYESDLGQANVDAAFRYSHFIGDWDVGAYFFHGTGREPRLVRNAAGTRLEPRYDLINQAGLDLQYTIGEWLWKLEAIAREGHGKTFAAAVGGFEYTFFQAFGTNADLGLLAEYQYDGRDDAAPRVAADNDIFAGARLALNDFQDTTALLGAVVDVDNQSTALFIEAERRLGDNWKLEFESRWFLNAQNDDPLAAVEDDDLIQLRISYFY